MDGTSPSAAESSSLASSFCQVRVKGWRARTQVQGERAFISYKYKKKKKKSYPEGENRLARQDKARQGRAGQDTRHTQHSMTNSHGTANTRRLNREQMRRVTRKTQVGQMNQ